MIQAEVGRFWGAIKRKNFDLEMAKGNSYLDILAINTY